jgi:hypothetical protein
MGAEPALMASGAIPAGTDVLGAGLRPDPPPRSRSCECPTIQVEVEQEGEVIAEG